MGAPLNYAAITTLDDLKRMVDTLGEQGKPLGFDIETGYYGPDHPGGSLDMYWDQQFICGFSLTNSTSWARYVPVAHDAGLAPNLPEWETWEVMKPLLETVPVYAHNMQFEKCNLRALDRKGRGPRIEINTGGDTMLQEYVLSLAPSFGLKDLVQHHFGHRMIHIEELFDGITDKKKKCIRFNILELTPQVTHYGCEDSLWCLALKEKNEARAKAERAFIYALEHGIMEMLCDMRDYGMNIEWGEMEHERQLAVPFRTYMEKAVKESLGALSGQDLTLMNLASPKQLKTLLYHDMGLTTTRLTKTANDAKNADKAQWEKMSTDKEAMKALSKDHPPIKKLLELREVDNHINRFKKWLDENHFAQDGRAHPHFGQSTVASGRFAASDPPVHQMPKDWRYSTELGLDPYKMDPDSDISERCWAEWKDTHTPYKEYWVGNFRNYLTASPDHYLLGFDYSQIELRIMAGVSQEPILLDAFARGIDVHSVTAGMMLGKPLEAVSKKLDRPIGKTMNFALLYQMGWKSLAERLAISDERAKELYSSYFDQFASITSWMARAKSEGMRNGYAETCFGRRVTVHELASSNRAIIAKGQRLLINAPIQGGAADYMKVAMLRVKKVLTDRGWWGTKVMVIHNLHDALVFEVSNDIDPNLLREVLQEAVVFPLKGFPKIVADWEIGHANGAMQEWKSGVIATFEDGEWILSGVSTHAEPEVEHDEPEPEPEEVEEETPEPESEPTVDVGTEVVVEVTTMPDRRKIERFKELVKRTPGENIIILRTPQGEARCSWGTGLSSADRDVLSIIFGGAKVFHLTTEQSLDAFAEGITL